MTDTYLASSDSAAMGRLRYAEACLKQGMGYQAAALASDVCASDLKAFAPGYEPTHREAPALNERTPLGRCAAIMPTATTEELGQIAAMALRFLCEAAGISAVEAVCKNSVKAMPVQVTTITPRGRVMDIVDRVAERHGITREQIMSRSTSYGHAHPRQEAYAALRRETGMSYTMIGRLFSRDHSTVISGITAHDERAAKGW